MKPHLFVLPLAGLALAGCGVAGHLNATPHGHQDYQISGNVSLTPPSLPPTSSSSSHPSTSPSRTPSPASSPPSQSPPSSSHAVSPSPSPGRDRDLSGQGRSGCGPACQPHSQMVNPPTTAPSQAPVSFMPVTLNDSGGSQNPLPVQITVQVPAPLNAAMSHTNGPGQLSTLESGSASGYHGEPGGFFNVTISQYPQADLARYPLPGHLHPGPLGNGSEQTSEAFHGPFGDSLEVVFPHLPNGNVGTVDIVVPQNHAAWLPIIAQSIKIYS